MIGQLHLLNYLKNEPQPIRQSMIGELHLLNHLKNEPS